jgi:S-adenosylmethionine hydrolase
VDRFGNLTTNIREADLAALGGPGLHALEVTLGALTLPLSRTYADVEVGHPCALVGSSGRLEIAVHRGRADAVAAASPGARVRVRRRG